MSATGRGNPRTGGVHDVNDTPPWAVHRLLDHPEFAKILGDAAKGVWLEPCASHGSIVRAVQEHGAFPDVRWIVSEIREECREPLSKLPNLVVPPIIGNFLSDAEEERIADVVLTNPPYRWAGEFLDACSRKARFVCFLVRAGFLEGATRYPVFSKCPPDDFILPQRPSFDEEGVDATRYDWMIWDMDNPERPFGRMFLLGLTPLSVRGEPKKRKLKDLAAKVEDLDRRVTILESGGE